MDKSLEERIKILEETEEIKQLKSRYVYCVDERDWDGVLDYFSEDCIVDFGQFGKYRGKKALEKFFKVDYPPVMSFTVHYTQDPIIVINGDQAKRKWYSHASATFAETNQAVWTSVKYEDEFVREKGRWKCKSSRIHYFYFTPYEEGWAKKRMV